ncbi:transposase [Aquibacillus halophilus]|uniref:Transposase n=1 Tax=Aquibacillus halophilus TaxID=930132 RepID=A0A6A8DBR9_9BACI|nr:transposase [Aquibacillus halophilus]MRH41211.1 transposase [Aquibacillus halophilus]
MGRKQRVWIANSYYHIVCRGNRRDALFRDDSDFIAFFYILQKVFDRYPFELASYCIMTNHFHLQLRSTEHLWSSYKFYQPNNYGFRQYMNPHVLLNYFSGTLVEKKRAYCEYVDREE